MIEIHLSGNELDKAEVIAKEFLDELSFTEPSIHHFDETPLTRDPTIIAAIAGVIIAIPGAVIATRDLLKKKRLEQRVEELEEELVRMKGSGKIIIKTNKLIEIEIDKQSSSDIIQQLIEHINR